MNRLVRILRIVGTCVLAFILLLFAAVQLQQRLLRYRAERLVADMQQIRLYQSTWADAKRLMQRWGAWGHYDGACTSTACAYKITVSDVSNRHFEWLMRNGGFRIYSLLGGRSSKLIVSFNVQDGIILRESAGVSVTASPKAWPAEDEFPLTLIVETKSRQRLRQTQNDLWIMGDDDQLAEHPYYKAGRPGGCKINCRDAVITYSTRTPPAEITRLTSFNFSCMTQFNSCMELDQLLPAAKEWNFYHEATNSAMQQLVPPYPKCATPLWVIARDNRYALIVQGISKSLVKEPGLVFSDAKGNFEKGPAFEKEEAAVKIKALAKGQPPWPIETTVIAHPYVDPATPDAAEHLFPGKKYIVFPVGDDRRDQLLTKDSPIELDRCGIWEDSPEHRRELTKGLAQNDNFHGPELR